MARRRNWAELLLNGPSSSALGAAEQDLLPDGTGYASVFEVTDETDRLETALALCDISPGWPKDFDYVEFEAGDLLAIGAAPAVHSPANGDTRCRAVNERHHDVLLNGPQRQHLANLIAQRTTGPTIPRIRRRDIEKAAASSSWLPAQSQLR